jgi:hypothetical protein
MSDRYIDQVLDGRTLWTDADDFVERWHESDSTESLHEYLGLTWDEYALWTEKPETLRLILASYTFGEPLNSLLERTDELAVAARGLEPKDADSVQRWLEKTGRLPKR